VLPPAVQAPAATALGAARDRTCACAEQVWWLHRCVVCRGLCLCIYEGDLRANCVV